MSSETADDLAPPRDDDERSMIALLRSVERLADEHEGRIAECEEQIERSRRSLDYANQKRRATIAEIKRHRRGR